MPFQKGNTHGKGRPPVPEDVKEARKFNRREIELILTKFLQMTPIQLEAVKTNPQSTAMELFIHSIVVNGINKGDPTRLDFLLTQILGKLKENVSVEFTPIRVRTRNREYVLEPGSPPETG